MKKTNTYYPLIGAHLSINKGLADVFVQAEELGCSTLQCFTKSGRQWYAKPLTEEEITLFKHAHAAHNNMPLVAHASYLINIGSSDPILAQKSTAALADELRRCEQLGIHFLVVHPGAHRNTDVSLCLERIAQNLTTILKEVPGSSMILLETMAGQGSTIGSSFKELGTIINMVGNNARVGVCLDTCHVFAAGLSFSSNDEYEKLWHDFDTQIGKQRLKVIHMNDSQKACGSRVDRHCDIGKGEIGIESFRHIMNDKTLINIPKILETPKESATDDARNLDTLRSLVQK